MKKLLIYLFLLAISSQLSAADELFYHDYTYDPNIKTVQFYRGHYENSYPILFIEGGYGLTLEFDELLSEDEEPESEFMVDLISCTEGWEASNVLSIVFYEGFPQQRLDNWQEAYNGKTAYTHYRYSFPRKDESFKMSGNYILKVYRNNSDRDLVLTRRFVVVEKLANIQATGMLNATLNRRWQRQIQFSVETPENLSTFSPAADLHVHVLQNFCWGNQLHSPRPTFIRNKILDYRFNVRSDFGSGNEYHQVDLRSTQLYGITVADITELRDYWNVTVMADKVRTSNPQKSRRDFNGSYIVEATNWRDPDVEADYLKVHFRLDNSRFPDKKVYVLSELSDWQLKDEYEMTFNKKASRYELSTLLKQGVYDYSYALYDTKTGELDLERAMGRGAESENYYVILVYFRSPTDVNDRLIGYYPYNYVDE